MEQPASQEPPAERCCQGRLADCQRASSKAATSTAEAQVTERRQRASGHSLIRIIRRGIARASRCCPRGPYVT